MQQNRQFNPTPVRARKAMSLVGNRPAGARRCLEAATMGVTVAVEEARQRGAMSTYDAKHLSRPERRQYERLCASEWGITEWAQGESPNDMRRRDDEDHDQFDNVVNLFGAPSKADLMYGT